MGDIALLVEKVRQVCAEAAAGCTSCGVCTGRCELLSEPGWDARAICAESLEALHGANSLEELRRGIAGHAQLYRFMRTCLGCDRCTARCPQGLSLSRLRAAWRDLLRGAGYIGDGETAGLEVDRIWDIFSVYRAIQGIAYDDLPLLEVAPVDAVQAGADGSEAPKAPTLFFPGCTLCSYAPALTRAAFRWLEEHMGPCLMATQCCASTLEGVGEGQRAAVWKRRVLESACDQGVSRIVTVCPGCQLRLEPVAAEVAPHLEFVPLARLMADAGVRVDAAALEGCALPVCVVDSCQDRAGEHGPAIRELFDQVDAVDFPATGKDAWCCGASGTVNPFDMRFVRGCTRHQMARGVQAGAGTLVTACPTCAYSYAFERWTSAAEGDAGVPDIGSLNYLEAVFGQRIDWPATLRSLQDMWSGEHADWAMRRLFPDGQPQTT